MRLWIYLAVFSTAFLLSACSPKHSEIVVAEFEGDNITMGEFEKAYSKSAGGFDAAKDDSLSQYVSFLDLYVNYRLKLEDAYKRGYNTNTDLLQELNDYKKQVGESFLIENDIMAPAVKKMHERRKYEFRISHLMVLADSISFDQAHIKALGFIDSVRKGKSFEELVVKYSDDASTKNKGGDVYYLTSGDVFPQFEDVIYSTKEGEVSSTPVRSNYGYHVIKVTEKRERIPSLRASHILVRFSAPDTTESYNKALEVLQKAKNGEDFANLAQEYSEDEGSKVKGGDLGFFERRRMVPAFDEAAFNLKEGEISGLVKTNFGYHIIKVIEKKKLPTFEDEKDQLRDLYKQISYNPDYRKYVDSLKTKYGFKLNDSMVEKAVKLAAEDTLTIGPKYWESSLRNNLKDSVLYSFANDKETLDSFFTTIITGNKNFGKKVDKYLITSNIGTMSERYVIEAEAMRMEERSEEFKNLMDDYKNGIYVFKIQEEEIWNKINADSSKIFDYYTQNKDNYRWNDRVNFSEIYTRKDSLINLYYSKLQEGADFDTLAMKHTERTGFKSKKGNHGLVDVESGELAKKANELTAAGQYTKPFKVENGYAIVKLIEKKSAGIKTFDEAKSEVMSAYQEKESARLEEEYVAKLKQTYKPEVHHEELKQAFKSEE